VSRLADQQRVIFLAHGTEMASSYLLASDVQWELEALRVRIEGLSEQNGESSSRELVRQD
jgi:hypothetical protein